MEGSLFEIRLAFLIVLPDRVAQDDLELVSGFAVPQLQHRLGRPEEIAQLAVFLASPEAAFIQGQALVCDGGWTAHAGF